MADRKDLYRFTAQIVAGGILMAAGPAPMVATGAVAVGLAALAGLFRDKASAALDAAVAEAVGTAEYALRDSREFTDDHFARATILLETAPRTIDPAAYADAARQGDPESRMLRAWSAL